MSKKRFEGIGISEPVTPPPNLPEKTDGTYDRFEIKTSRGSFKFVFNKITGELFTSIEAVNLPWVEYSRVREAAEAKLKEIRSGR